MPLRAHIPCYSRPLNGQLSFIKKYTVRTKLSSTLFGAYVSEDLVNIASGRYLMHDDLYIRVHALTD